MNWIEELKNNVESPKKERMEDMKVALSFMNFHTPVNWQVPNNENIGEALFLKLEIPDRYILSNVGIDKYIEMEMFKKEQEFYNELD